MQCCILWSARQEKAISPLAFKVYFAAHEVKYWRCKVESDEPYHYEPYGFQPTDVSRLLPGVDAAKIARAFSELEAINILKMTDRGIWFAERIDEVTVNERVRHRALAMFNQLHQDTREKLVKFPRRLLKLLVQCGRRMVRTATLIGMLLTTMLTKRTEKYEGYKGCVKAKWIANVFGVDASRVKSERAKLIDEGWFTREPTTPQARKKFGQWVRLNLTPAQPTPLPEEPASMATAKVQPQNPPDEPKMQPPLNPSLSSTEVMEDNQTLSTTPPEPGAYQPMPLENPSWTNIKLTNLHSDDQSETLRHQAIQTGHLKDTLTDQINFYAAIAHALRVTNTNACGLLRTLVEKALWHFLTQADENKALQRLQQVNDMRDSQKTPLVPADSFLMTSTKAPMQSDEPQIALSEDALTVQVLSEDLQRTGFTGDVFRTVKRQGYLQDWDRQRWLQAEQEVMQARWLQARQRYQAMEMMCIQEVIDDGPIPTFVSPAAK